MRKVICIILVVVFFIILFTFNDTVIAENKSSYYYHSVPYTPLANENTMYIIRYTYTNASGFTVTDTYNYVYVQMGLDEYSGNTNGIGQGWYGYSDLPIGWVVFGTNVSLENGSFYDIDDFQVFVVTSHNYENGILTENSILKVSNDDFSKPFESGVLYRNNIIYYPRIDTLTFIETVAQKIESLNQPIFPSNGSVTDYFTFVIDEIVYLGQILGAIFNSFGTIF